MRKITAYTVAAVVTLGVLTNNIPDSNAAPAQPIPAPAGPVDAQQAGIPWTADRVGDSVVVKTDLGSLATDDGQFQVLDSTGKVVAGLPLSYDMRGLRFPIAAKIDGNTATLTPNTDPTAAAPVDMITLPADPLKPVDAQFDADLGRAAAQFGLATGVGTLLGTIVGLGGGCILGAVVGAALMTPIFVPGWVGSCIAGAAIGTALGAAAGIILLGVPVGIASAIQFFQMENAPAPVP
ncbi:hypothetical protein ACFXG4_28275 [Nocardia sp. NPDC059246]|uniref:hypothetical protein n=1 Tax=unclassified Nocardia TaxID=2637762 RepID=UPI0036A6524E